MDVETARAEATALVERDSDALAMRSCWNCNTAHEHLRKAQYVIWCFECGRYFFKGVDITQDEGQQGGDGK